MEKVKLAIIDDHAVVLNGLENMLASVPELEIVLATSSGKFLQEFLAEHPADVLLLDIQMPEINGIDLCKLLHKQYPELKIIAFSSFDDTHYVKQIMRSGALGYVLKNADKQTILQAIKSVITGREFIDESLQKLLLHESLTGQKRSLFEIPLTKREKEILKLVAEENSSQEIADKLFLSLRTVETHRFNLTQKLGAKNTVSLVKEALKRGLID